MQRNWKKSTAFFTKESELKCLTFIMLRHLPYAKFSHLCVDGNLVKFSNDYTKLDLDGDIVAFGTYVQVYS